jgi:hypothetical protein
MVIDGSFLPTQSHAHTRISIFVRWKLPLHISLPMPVDSVNLRQSAGVPCHPHPIGANFRQMQRKHYATVLVGNPAPHQTQILGS